jgi:hypothetical protein
MLLAGCPETFGHVGKIEETVGVVSGYCRQPRLFRHNSDETS